MTLEQTELELKKLTVMPPWGRKQNDDWDKLSNFVYQQPSYEQLLALIAAQDKDEAFGNYCIHRWYNTLSARALEEVFCSQPRVKANKNKYDKLVDFSISSIPFDHKTSIYPRGYPETQAYAEQNPASLIEWLYKQQSLEGRYHTENRLFVVLYAADGQHWRLRAEISKMKTAIEDYVLHFDKKNLTLLMLEEESAVLSDIVWIKL